MFAIELSMEKRIKIFLSAWFSDLPAINATSFRMIESVPKTFMPIRTPDLHRVLGESISQKIQPKTYNYGGGLHLANQNQNQCIRREKGNCKICYAAVGLEDFSVSGSGASKKFVTKGCCSYGVDGKYIFENSILFTGSDKKLGISFSNFSCMFLNPNNFVQFQF